MKTATILMATLLLFPLSLFAEIKNITIFSDTKEAAQCIPSDMAFVKMCQRFDVELLTDYNMPTIYGATYRGQMNTQVVLELEFKFAGGDFSLDVDGIRYPVPSDIPKVTFPIPRNNNDKLTIKLINNRSTERRIVKQDYSASIKSMHLLLDNQSFLNQISSKENLRNAKQQIVSSNGSILKWKAAYTIMEEIASSFYLSLTADSLKQLSIKQKEISDLITSLIASDNACYWDDLNETEKKCLEKEERDLLPKISAAISTIAIPELWKKSDGTIKTFSEYLDLFIPADSKSKEMAKEIFELLAKQNDREIESRYLKQNVQLNTEIKQLDKEIIELRKTIE
ncbi:MAG: hypothetical protein HQK52_21825 [Oligoflexia bacterium]|nr:hypothetical protein [Oligoflexia bacterium]